MAKKLNVLLVDNHPIILDAYRYALRQISEVGAELEFFIRSACDCDMAISELEEAVHSSPIDLVFLEIQIPPSKDMKFLSGEDLGLRIRSLFKGTKILVLTSCNDNYRLKNIISTLNPDGLLAKTDVSFNSLTEAIESVIHDPPFYSKRIINLMRQHIVNEIDIDALDKKLLFHLANGYKTRELTSMLPLSRGAIDKRKKKLMNAFEVEDRRESTLLHVAKNKGFI